jgi:molybdenum cofactor biosynthesis enzyme MoaA
LDTLDPFKFEIMTRRQGHDAVLRSLKLALASQELKSVKLNVVIVKGLNDDEVSKFIELTRLVQNQRLTSLTTLTFEKDTHDCLSALSNLCRLMVGIQHFVVRHVRLIYEGNKWDKSKMVPSSTLLEHIRMLHPELSKESDELNDTSRSYRIPGYVGTIGFISSMSDHFCGTCNRLRLTADGQIKV